MYEKHMVYIMRTENKQSVKIYPPKYHRFLFLDLVMSFLIHQSQITSQVYTPLSCSIIGIEEVKVAILGALASWISVSVEAVQPDVVSFISSGLKEKETLRKSHLRCLRAMCKHSDSLTKVRYTVLCLTLFVHTISTVPFRFEAIHSSAFCQVSSLVDSLVQLVKTGFTKATQRLDGIYALFALGKIVSVDSKAGSVTLRDLLQQSVIILLLLFTCILADAFIRLCFLSCI
jgi:hypothetical protein